MQRSLKGVIITVVLAGFVAMGLFALPDSIQADKYLLAAKKHIDAGDYDQAVGYFEKILELDVDIADDFYYHYGSTLYKSGNYSKAVENLTKYIELTGRGSKYYQQALELLIEAEENFYEVGDTGPAGGIVFYDKGFYSDGWRYLEAAPKDQSSGIKWGPLDIKVDDTSEEIGAGAENTKRIVRKLGNGKYAAKLCYDLTLNGYDDWFLPSINELKQISRAIVGMNENSWYWSSTESYDDNAEAERLLGIPHYKNKLFRIRAIRAF